jgi:predicted lipase
MLSIVMARLCIYSYKNEINQPLPKPFETFEKVNEKNIQAYLFEGKKHLAVVFRGTDEISDIFNNINIFPVKTKIGRIHKGFYNAFLKINYLIKDKIETSEKKIFVTGHSLGAAIATIFSAVNKEKNPILITFGSPMVGTKSFTKQNKDLLHIRWINSKDIICKIPFFFSHFGEKRILESNSFFSLKKNHKIRKYFSLIENLSFKNKFLEFEINLKI